MHDDRPRGYRDRRRLCGHDRVAASAQQFLLAGDDRRDCGRAGVVGRRSSVPGRGAVRAGQAFLRGHRFLARGVRYTTEDLYAAAVRIFRTDTPVVAAVHGAAVGGGLVLALTADFRVAAPEARFSANFARLGFHQGFGLSVTLPRLVGPQVAADLLFTGRRVPGEEAVNLGLADGLADQANVRAAAWGIAREIAMSAPLAVRSIRATLRGDLADQVEAATAHEHREQARLQQTADFAEGSRAMAERRIPEFRGE